MLVGYVKYTYMYATSICLPAYLSVYLFMEHTLSSWAQTLSLSRICPGVPLGAPVVGA